MTNSTAELRQLKEEKLRRIYRSNPDLYAEQVLKVTWWSKQLEIARSVVTHQKTFVRACHSVGKSHFGGGIVNWHFDSFKPSISITTAPTKQQVEDVLWKEIRTQRRGRPGLQPKAARMETEPDHFASGYTARSDAAFQGRHEDRVFILFDEAVGIDPAFWEAAEGMMTSEGCRWLVFLNPTDTASRAYEEELSGKWNVIPVSILEHPNIIAQLAGLPPVFPKAVSLPWLYDKLERWCSPISPRDKRASDIEFPPASGNWYRPGPLFEGRVLGRWPTTGSTSVWSEAIWLAAQIPQPIPFNEPLKIGCDVARFGDDYTSMVVRRGPCALHHETHNGWKTTETAGQLKALAKQFVFDGEDPREVEILIDDDGVGGGVTDNADGWNFCPVSGASTPIEAEDYPNRRSELWFTVAERADNGNLDLSRLSDESRSLLRRQLMQPTWKMNAQGHRVVEPKDMTKKRIQRSPDDADALNLSFAQPNIHKIEIIRW